MTTSVRLGEIVAALGGELRGEPETLIARIGPLESAAGDAITFISQPKLRSLLETSAAAAIVLSPALVPAAPERCALVVTDDPYLYFARLTQWWARRVRPLPPPGIHPTAVVAPDAAGQYLIPGMVIASVILLGVAIAGAIRKEPAPAT